MACGFASGRPAVVIYSVYLSIKKPHKRKDHWCLIYHTGGIQSSCPFIKLDRGVIAYNKA